MIEVRTGRLSAAQTRRQLLRAGMALFLVSLVFSFPLPIYVNSRMVVSAHVIGVTESLFIVVLGLIWRDLRLGDRVRTTVFWLRLYGGFANWAICTLAAVWGTSFTLKVAGAGFHAALWQEHVVTGVLTTVGLVDVWVGACVVWGLRGEPNLGEGGVVE